MKKVVLMAILAIGMVAFAQEGKRDFKRERFTPEQRIELRVKQMTLDLDLSDKQQVEIKKLLTEHETTRKNKMEEMKKMKKEGARPTADERFEMQKNRLDEQIDFKNRMKKILNKEQMDKWETIQKDRKEKMEPRYKRNEGFHKK